MTEASKRLSFGDTTLHQPEFLDIHEVLQAASHPSVEQFQRALQHLEAANFNRFVKLKEVAKQQATGSGESDLRRLKRHFASLKNTFVLYDIKQSFIEGLADGCPDGSEESQLQEVEEEVKKHSAEVKQYKERNAQVQKEVEELIESIAATYQEFNKQRAAVSSHLDCLAVEAAEQESSQLVDLPDLEDGPDEVACRALLDNEAAQTRALEAAIASEEAQSDEMLAAIQSEEEELKGLQAQLQELETNKSKSSTQEVSARFAEAAAWCDEMAALVSVLGGVSLIAAKNSTLHLRLTPAGGSAHELKLHFDSSSCSLLAGELSPASVEVSDIVEVASRGHSRLSFVVREVLARLSAHSKWSAELAEAQSKFQLSAVADGQFQAVLPGGVHVSLVVPEAWPLQPLRIMGLRTPSGVPMSADVVKQMQSGPVEAEQGLVALLEALSARMQHAFGGGA